jgi:biotin operon repressor
MRADRLLSILLLLQVHRRQTARELAQRLEVSERTIHRDMEALSAAGFPVFAERGSGGGWMLVEGYKTNLTGLNKNEIQALFLTKPLRLLADLGLDSVQCGDASFEPRFLPHIETMPSTPVNAYTSTSPAGIATTRLSGSRPCFNKPCGRNESSSLPTSAADVIPLTDWRTRLDS